MTEVQPVRDHYTARYLTRIPLPGEDLETALSEFGRCGAAFAAAHLSPAGYGTRCFAPRRHCVINHQYTARCFEYWNPHALGRAERLLVPTSQLWL